MVRILKAGEHHDVIITPFIQEFLRKSFQYGAIFGGHPFKWNKELQRAEMGPGRQRFHWRMNMVLAFAYMAFFFYRCVEVNLDEYSTNGQKIHMKFMITYYLLAAVIYYVVIRNGEQYVCYINQYLDTMRKFEREFVRENTRTPSFIKVIGRVMQQLYWSLSNCHTLVLVILIIPVLSPDSVDQLSSLLPSPTTMPLEVKLAFAVVTAYVQYMYAANAIVIVVGGFCGLFMYLFLLGELVPSSRTIAKPHLRQHGQVLVMYRRLQFQVILHQSMYNQIIPAAKLLMMLWGIYTTYGAIRTEGVSSLAFGFVALFSFGYLAVLFTYLAELQVRSSRAKHYWRSQRIADPFIVKSFESLPDITFKLRGFYYVDRSMILTMLNTMIEETVTFLLLNQ